MRTRAARLARSCSLLLALVVLLAAAPVHAGDGPAAGMRVYRDPATGAFVPSPVAPPGAESPAADTTSQPLGGTHHFVEVPGRTSAGGVIVDLQGAFQSEVTATVGADGRVVTHCHQAEPQ